MFSVLNIYMIQPTFIPSVFLVSIFRTRPLDGKEKGAPKRNWCALYKGLDFAEHIVVQLGFDRKHVEP